MPDLLSDDLAVRRYNKPGGGSSPDALKNVPSYLLCSPAFTPTLPGEEIYHDFGEPNIEKDDWSYRRLTQAEAAPANTLPPPPPFGIPNMPTQCHNSIANDYVRAELDPIEKKKVYYHVKPFAPHLVRDDMAFRNYRKDQSSPETRKSDSPPLLPVTTRNVLLINAKKSLRATRSLSTIINNVDLNSNYYLERDHNNQTTALVNGDNLKARSMTDVTSKGKCAGDAAVKTAKMHRGRNAEAEIDGVSRNTWQGDSSRALSEPENRQASRDRQQFKLPDPPINVRGDTKERAVLGRRDAPANQFSQISASLHEQPPAKPARTNTDYSSTPLTPIR